MDNGKQTRLNSLQNLRHKIENIKKAQTLEEYFILIGVDPQISVNEDLYKTPIVSLNEKYSESDFKPKILSKFPPINKKYINIDETIIDLCFPNGFLLLQSDKKPKSTFQHFILDNSFYSIDYPLKYISCLKIYESLNNYYLLHNEIKKKGRNIPHNENCEINNNLNNNDLNNEFKSYYFPKVLCMISTQNFFQVQEKILKQIYKYYKTKKIKKNIPIEKKILSILFNIPLPPKGTLALEYSLLGNNKKIEIKKEKIFKRINVLLNNYFIPNGKIKLFMEQDRISRRKHAFCHFHI